MIIKFRWIECRLYNHWSHCAVSRNINDFLKLFFFWNEFFSRELVFFQKLFYTTTFSIIIANFYFIITNYRFSYYKFSRHTLWTCEFTFIGFFKYDGYIILMTQQRLNLTRKKVESYCSITCLDIEDLQKCACTSVTVCTGLYIHKR